MGEIRGTISNGKLEYGRAMIMPLDVGDETVSGGGSISGISEWTLRWNGDGFVGHGWSGWTNAEQYISQGMNAVDAYLNSLNGTDAGANLFDRVYMRDVMGDGSLFASGCFSTNPSN